MTPTRKVGLSGAVGALTVILVWILSGLGVDVPAEVSTAITSILMFAVGYRVPDKTNTELGAKR
ncbi:hypothetical protein [Amycolatopsis cihanbeyliensis]|uniref:Holin n=1 Tax=Amycolatopsis cihanbeyliensis TaxID=1128664 RepID=A0A542DNM4_AMYCI|nr:hypothetical protein [Amycolatopsis cihanbeyliensis]TQJ04702.1 hypothetical protein FB471_4509 [Amycolatopsis cihanbeyliensis]